ncbi:hypothetical protein [Sphingobium yanoikuyae]|jgi:hypothetical protein
MSERQIRAALRRHYPNISSADYAELQRLRFIVLGADETARISLEEAFLD